MRTRGSAAGVLWTAFLLLLSSPGGCSKTPSNSDDTAAAPKPVAPANAAPPAEAGEEPTGATPLDRARQEIQAVVQGPDRPTPASRPRISETEFRQHFAVLAAATTELQELQKRERQFRQILDRVRTKAEMVFQGRLADDPLAAVWKALNSYPGLELEQLRDFKSRIEQAEERIQADRDYDPPAVLAVADETRAWIAPRSVELDHRLADALELRVTLRTVSVFFARTHEELQQLVRDGYLQIGDTSHPHHWEVYNAGKGGESDHRDQDAYAALRRRLGRHTYALNVRLQPRPQYPGMEDSERPGAQPDPDEKPFVLGSAKTRWSWPLTELYTVCASYEYWYDWATDDSWYRGTSYRLDPAVYPKDAPATKELWRDFKSIIFESFVGPDGELRGPGDPPFGMPRWSLGSLRRLSRNPSPYRLMFGQERMDVDRMNGRRSLGHPALYGISTYFLTPTEVEQLHAESPPIPSPAATAELRAAGEKP